MTRTLAVFAALAVAGCSSVHTQAQQAEDNKALMKKFIDRMNKHDLSVIDEVFDASFVDHETAPGVPPTREGLKQMMAQYLRAFPDMQMKVEHLVAEGDLVVVHIASTGTHKGEMMGIPATGIAIKVNEMHLARVKDGKFVEHWGVEDQMAMMLQLGLMPDPTKKK
ncbi:MAG: ester cyclase [Planctomycetes bacterium]|nr:ester cyclase [Planctomycetota bacterium]